MNYGSKMGNQPTSLDSANIARLSHCASIARDVVRVT